MGLTFGTLERDQIYHDRQAVYGLAFEAGRLAVVDVSTRDGSWRDLPGGAIEPGESEWVALVREFAEETGLVVAPVDEIAAATQHFRQPPGPWLNNHFRVHLVDVIARQPELQIEHDHRLVWLDPLEALATLRHDGHAWAVTAWLRRSASRALS